MRSRTSVVSGLALAASMSLAACGKSNNASTSGGEVATPAYNTPSATSTSSSATMDSSAAMTATTTPAKHHSKLAGAAIGAVAGHMLGGHAVAGAAAGALIQHERNKHP